MAVGDPHVFSSFLLPVLKQLIFQSHSLLFSHASAEVRGKNTPEGKLASTGSQTHNHQVMSPTLPPLSHTGRADSFQIIDDSIFESIHSPPHLFHCFNYAYVGKQIVAWEKLCKVLLRKWERIDRFSGRHKINEILMKAKQNTIQLINQFFLFQSILFISQSYLTDIFQRCITFSSYQGVEISNISSFTLPTTNLTLPN